MKDLSEHHGLISNLFSQPEMAEEFESFRLDPSQIHSFEENGFVSGIKLLNDEQITVLREELRVVCDPEHPGNKLFHEFHSNEAVDPSTVLFHALGAWRITAGFHDSLWNPAFLVPASQLLNGPVRFWHDQLFYKPAHHGGVVAWHQDYSYWTRTTPLCHLTCWIGLDDTTIENGCLHYIPGSHKWDLLPVTGLTNDMESIYEVLTDDQREQFKPVPVELNAGECSFHHGLTVHGSYENRSPNPRRAYVINVALDGVRSDTSEPLLKDVPVVEKGTPLRGQFFPLLYSG